MKYIYLERLFRHLSLFQRIRLHRTLDVIFMILFPRLWIKRCMCRSMAATRSVPFVLTQKGPKSQGLGNSPKMESNFLNISQTLHYLDLFLTKIRFPFLTVNHPRPILKSRSNFRGIAEEKSNFHSNTTMSSHKVLRKSTRMQNQLSQNFSATSFASFGGKIAKQSPKETRSQSGGEDINRIILFPLSLARAVALLVSLLFSYLTVTPAYGQEPVGLVIGDSVPNWFWEKELQVINHPKGCPKIKLEDYKNKLLVLDFWANSCSLCIKSIDSWNKIFAEFDDEIAVLPIHIYYPSERAKQIVQERDWIFPISVGNATDTLLNQLFFEKKRFGQVWIKDNKLYAIPTYKMISEDIIRKVLAGREVDIDMELYLTYSNNSSR